MTHWSAGQRVTLTEDEWAGIAAGFLGSGFRLRLPGHAAAIAHARGRVDAVATLLGTQVDPAPWDDLGEAPAYELVGGWEYRLDRTWGPAWTAVSALPLPSVLGRDAEAVSLPWTWSSASPTAGLPMISSMEEDLALAHAGDRVGLWWDHRDLLCSTTAGPPLVETADGGWLTPDEASGAVRSWAYDEAARRLSARPATLGRDLVAAARAVVAVSDLGVSTRLVAVETRQMVEIRPQ